MCNLCAVIYFLLWPNGPYLTPLPTFFIQCILTRKHSILLNTLPTYTERKYYKDNIMNIETEWLKLFSFHDMLFLNLIQVTCFQIVGTGILITRCLGKTVFNTVLA